MEDSLRADNLLTRSVAPGVPGLDVGNGDAIGIAVDVGGEGGRGK